MQPGKLDQFIIIQQRPPAKSGSGANIPGAPVEIFRGWASITVSGGRGEVYSADKLGVKTQYRVRIRNTSGLDETMEISWGSRTLDIIDAPYLGPRPRFMSITAEERR